MMAVIGAGEVLPRTYTREELLRYLETCCSKCQETIGALLNEQTYRLCRFTWGELPFPEPRLYNLRYVQEYAAQLLMFLGQQAGKSASWASQAQERPATKRMSGRVHHFASGVVFQVWNGYETSSERQCQNVSSGSAPRSRSSGGERILSTDPRNRITAPCTA